MLTMKLSLADIGDLHEHLLAETATEHPSQKPQTRGTLATVQAIKSAPAQDRGLHTTAFRKRQWNYQVRKRRQQPRSLLVE